MNLSELKVVRQQLVGGNTSPMDDVTTEEKQHRRLRVLNEWIVAYWTGLFSYGR